VQKQLEYGGLTQAKEITVVFSLLAICSNMWEGRFQEDSYSDYPQSAKDNAERGIRLNEE
jgi:hypothetical protein